jgi:hypothetical protein
MQSSRLLCSYFPARNHAYCLKAIIIGKVAFVCSQKNQHSRKKQRNFTRHFLQVVGGKKQRMSPIAKRTIVKDKTTVII